MPCRDKLIPSLPTFRGYCGVYRLLIGDIWDLLNSQVVGGRGAQLWDICLTYIPVWGCGESQIEMSRQEPGNGDVHACGYVQIRPAGHSGSGMVWPGS